MMIQNYSGCASDSRIFRFVWCTIKVTVLIAVSLVERAGLTSTLITLEHFSTAGAFSLGHCYGGHFLIQIGSSAEEVSGDHFLIAGDISLVPGAGVLDS